MIIVKNLSKVFSKHKVLDAINIAVAPGDVYGIIGLSGAGKSTLIRCLSFLETPTEGQIFLNGIELTQENIHEERKKIGMIFQHFNLFSSKTVEENVAFPLELCSLSKEEIKRRVQELLQLVHLEHKAKLYPSALSGGEKQRVGIARALVSKPSILLCDEATSALDPKNTRQILHLLSSLNKKLNLTILLITHEMDVIKSICNKVAVIEKGSIVEEGRVVDLFSNPVQNITKSLLELRGQHLPTSIFKNPLYRLVFNGPKAKEPIISRMIRNFAIDANILLGSLDYLQDTIIGSLTVEFQGSPEEIEKALSFLKENDVNCERIENE